MQDKRYFSTAEAAKILGISRIAVFKRIKNGQLKAKKFGRNFIIDKSFLISDQSSSLNNKQKKIIDQAVQKTVREYGKTLKMLADA